MTKRTPKSPMTQGAMKAVNAKVRDELFDEGGYSHTTVNKSFRPPDSVREKCVDALNTCIHKAGCQSTTHPIMTAANMYIELFTNLSTEVAFLPKKKGRSHVLTKPCTPQPFRPNLQEYCALEIESRRRGGPGARGPPPRAASLCAPELALHIACVERAGEWPARGQGKNVFNLSYHLSHHIGIIHPTMQQNNPQRALRSLFVERCHPHVNM